VSRAARKKKEALNAKAGGKRFKSVYAKKRKIVKKGDTKFRDLGEKKNV